MSALAQKAGARFTYPRPELNGAAGARFVQEYFDLARRANALQDQVTAGYARLPAGASPDAPLLAQENELRLLREQQRALQLEVEAIIERQVAQTIKAQGLVSAGVVFPPVLFRFYPLPLHLILSPRERIERMKTADLRADLTLTQREQIETALDAQLNISSLIEEIGGYGAYPPLVLEDASLSWVLSTVAHEWTHNYLTFRPLGWRYDAEPAMTTINETAASIIGDELGARVIEAFYPWIEPPPLSWQRPRQGEPPAGEEPAETGFSFGRFMRETRLETDRLLAAGDVSGAERYMEERRQILVQRGYAIRKLNQAYFAFHGLYGTGPSSVDPIGPKMEELRRLFPSLRAFVQTIEQFRGPADLDRALEAARKNAGQ